MIDYLYLIKILIISCFFLADILFTYISVINYRRKFPNDKDWAKMELNIILRKCWKKWGLNKGTLIGVLIIYPFFFLMILFLIANPFLVGMVCGMYMVIFIIHIENLILFKNEKEN